MKKRHIIILSLCLLAFWGKPQLAAAQFFSAKVNALAALTGNGERRSGCRRRGQVDARRFRLLESHKLRFVQLSAICRADRHETLALRSVRGPFHRRPANLWKLPVRRFPTLLQRRHGRLGFSYGYAWLLSKRWNVTAEIGIGVFYMKDTRRDRIPPEYESIFIHHYKRWVVGPSRAEISFNYLF